MSYVDPFKDLNDTKRKEREALLNHPEFNQAAGGSRHFAPPIVIPPAISRRDYFAAAALTGLLACGDHNYNGTLLAESASQMADMLIAYLDEAKA